MNSIKKHLRQAPGVRQILARFDELKKKNEQLMQLLKNSEVQTNDQIDLVRKRHDEVFKRVQLVEKENLNLKKQYEEVAMFQSQLIDKVRDQQQNAIKQTEEMKTEQQKPTSNSLFAENHALDAFYLHFENKFRGDEALIKERLKVYLPLFNNSSIDFKKYPVVDLGCGRGEMISLLKNKKINSIGIDMNESMVKRANDKGLKAEQGNAIDYLKNQGTGTLGAITGFHLIEHVPFEDLILLFKECQRTLVNDGFIIFETPNPENLMVATQTFYLDPSHLRPLPPSLIEFLSTSVGLRKSKIKRLHPVPNTVSEDQLTDSSLTGYEKHTSTYQDYAIIAYK